MIIHDHSWSFPHSRCLAPDGPWWIQFKPWEFWEHWCVIKLSAWSSWDTSVEELSSSWTVWMILGFETWQMQKSALYFFFRWEVLALRATSKIASSALLLVSQNLQVTIDCILMWQTGSPISKPYTYSIFNYISPLGSMSGFSSTITLGLIIGLTWCQCLLQYRELAAKANSAAANHHCRPPARLCDTKRNPDHSHISSL